MAFVHGKGTGVTLDGEDLSAFSTSVEFAREVDSHETTTFGKNSKTYQGGLKDGTCTIEGIYDNTALTGPSLVIQPLLGTVVELEYLPEGTGSGKAARTVNVLVTSFTETAPVADMVTFSCECQFSGDVSLTSQT